MQGSGCTALVELSYVSSASNGLPAAVFLRLAQHCWSHNLRAGLTGILRFDGSRFEQTLEGPATAILPLAARILADPRHQAIRIEGFRAIPARSFANWSCIGFDCDLDPSPAPIAEANLFHFPAAASRRPARALAQGAALVTS
jgi:hypothetical protein